MQARRESTNRAPMIAGETKPASGGSQRNSEEGLGTLHSWRPVGVLLDCRMNCLALGTFRPSFRFLPQLPTVTCPKEHKPAEQALTPSTLHKAASPRCTGKGTRISSPQGSYDLRRNGKSCRKSKSFAESESTQGEQNRREGFRHDRHFDLWNHQIRPKAIRPR